MTELDPADAEAIRGLAIRYALGLDKFDLDLALSVFTTDARFDATEFGLPMLTGLEAIRKFLDGHQQTVLSQMHLVANHLLAAGRENEATGTCYLYEEGRSVEGALSRVQAINTDRYVRTSRGWRIQERKIGLLVKPTDD